jgi:hypothetical protein
MRALVLPVQLATSRFKTQISVTFVGQNSTTAKSVIPTLVSSAKKDMKLKTTNVSDHVRRQLIIAENALHMTTQYARNAKITSNSHHQHKLVNAQNILT